MKSDINSSNDNPGQIQISQSELVSFLKLLRHNASSFLTYISFKFDIVSFIVSSQHIFHHTYLSSQLVISGGNQN